MNMRSIAAILFALGSGALVVAGAVADGTTPSAPERAATQELDRAQLERRLQSVHTLIESSSAARQVEASGGKDAQALRERARQTHQQAEETFKAGDLAKAARLLSEASVAMFEAVRLSAPEKVTGAKNQADYNARLESVRALLAAQKRISDEKSVKGTAETARAIERLMGEAQQLAAANQYEQARATLDRAYLIAKASIGDLRHGDTLVRSLKFANKEEEYRYEVDRNDTHQMLIKVLLEDKQAAVENSRSIKAMLEKAGQLRGQAEASASRGDHAAAVRLLEESTAELVKAIRNAGVYIPG